MTAKKNDTNDSNDSLSTSAPEPTTTPTPPAIDPLTALATAITTAMQQGNQQLAESIIAAQLKTQAPRHLTIDEVVERDPRLKAQQQRDERLRKSGRVFYQNNYKLTAPVLSDAEVDCLLQLQPGVFVSGLVTVNVSKPQGPHGDTRVEVWHNGATHEQRIALKTECRDLLELLQRCVQEAEARPRVVLA